MCNHEYMTEFKFCPYCGKKIVSKTESAMKRLRKAEKTDSNKYDLGFCLFHSAIWNIAQDIYCHDIDQVITIYNCPDDAAEKVFEIAEKIREEITPIYNKYKLMILDADSYNHYLISRKYIRR